MTPNESPDLVDCSERKMTFAEIEEFFSKRGMTNALEGLRDAAAEETKLLRQFDVQLEGRGGRPNRDRVQDAKDFLAEDICAFLNGALALSPDLVLNHRPRVAAAWALAELIKEGRSTE